MSEELREALGDAYDAVIEAFEDEYGQESWEHPPYQRERDAFARGFRAGMGHD